jgi:hypothetical protein
VEDIDSQFLEKLNYITPDLNNAAGDRGVCQEFTVLPCYTVRVELSQLHLDLPPSLIILYGPVIVSL